MDNLGNHEVFTWLNGTITSSFLFTSCSETGKSQNTHSLTTYVCYSALKPGE